MVFPIGHIGTLETTGLFSPQVMSLPSQEGVPLGITNDRQGFYFAPWQWKADGDIEGTSVRILGNRNAGKTTLAQIIAARHAGFRAADSEYRLRVSVDDTRRNAGVPEYSAWAEYLGSKHVDLAAYSVNLLDPSMKMDETEQSAVVNSVCQFVSGQELSTYERLAVQIALDRMKLLAPDHTSPEVLAMLLRGLRKDDLEAYVSPRNNLLIRRIQEDDPRVSEQLSDFANRGTGIQSEHFQDAAMHIASLLMLLLEGEYGRTFGGERSLSDMLREPVVALDFTGLNEQSQMLMESLLWMWRNSAVRRHDHEFMAHIELHDENWKRWRSLVYARNMVEHLKKIRGSGVLIVQITHRLSDADSVGTAGAEQQGLAINALKETDIWLIGKLPVSEVKRTKEFLGLSDDMANRLPSLATGQFCCVIGNRPPFIFTLLPTADELQFSQTNKASYAMVGR